MKRGAPQGSVIAATLFRLHIHFLPSYFSNCIIHLFADDLALVIKGLLEKKFSRNITEIEEKAEKVMKQLEKFSDDMILPVNISKTKSMLAHSIVSPTYPKISYKSQPIEYVKKYRYLGVNISVKLGWENYINERIKTISHIYSAMRIIFKDIKRKDIRTRKKIFSAYALPHFMWLFSTWFFFSERQKERISHTYCIGLRIIHNLALWDDYTTLVLSREKSIYDYLFSYWRRLIHHLHFADEALAFQMTWTSYLNVTAPEDDLWKNTGFRKNSTFLNRLRKQITHLMLDWIEFDSVHSQQYDYFKNKNEQVNRFIHKYFIDSS
jgi:hypothetical protein